MAHPQQIFDAHLHIIDAAYPLIANNGYLPESFGVKDYKARAEPLGVTSGAVVSGSFQGFDQSYLKAALSELGPGFVGVTQLPADTSDKELEALHHSGIRAVRFNLKRGGSEDVKALPDFALRIYQQFGWHVELYAGFDSLQNLKPVLLGLPAVSIDHLGLNNDGLPLLHEFVEAGIMVKATGFGRLDFDPYQAIKSLYELNPDALMFGTDLPSTRAPLPFSESHISQLAEVLDEAAISKIFWSNARRFYRLGA